MKSAAFNQFLPWILPLILLAVWQGLSAAGILASFIFSGYSHLEEAYRVAELPSCSFRSWRQVRNQPKLRRTI